VAALEREGFVRIRNFGFLANRRRATLLPLCFQLPQTEQELSTSKEPTNPRLGRKCGGPIWSSKDLLLPKSNFVQMQLHRQSDSLFGLGIDVCDELTTCLPEVRGVRINHHGRE
jgi:hypothetical protein